MDEGGHRGRLRGLISSRRLDGAAGLTGVVSRFLIDLARHSEDLPAKQSEQVRARVSDLVVTLLSDQLDNSTRVSKASASTGPAATSWTRGWPAARSPRSRTPAASAT